MNNLEFSFEESPWEGFLRTKKPGDTISAARLLAMLEEQGEDALEDALLDMEENGLALDISDLPRGGGTGEGALRLRQEMQWIRKGLDPKDLSEGDPLRLYLEELARIPAFGDEQVLALACADGDENARNALTNLGLSRVVELSKEYAGCGVLLLDLIQEGSMGLWQAVCQYREGPYGQLRDRMIRFYMAKAVTVQAFANGIGSKLRGAMEDYRAVDQRLLTELGRNPTLEEIAQGMHVGLEEAAAVKKMLEDARIQAKVRSADEETEEADPEQDLAVEDTAQFQMRQRILDLLSGLSQEDARLLNLRFGLEGGKPLSHEEAGRRLGLTPQEALAREAAALAKLRDRNR